MHTACQELICMSSYSSCILKATWFQPGLHSAVLSVCSTQALISLAPSFLVKPPTPAPSWEACQSSDPASAIHITCALLSPVTVEHPCKFISLSAAGQQPLHPATVFPLTAPSQQRSNDTCGQSATLQPLSRPATTAQSDAEPSAAQTQSTSPT